jgi:hypothetical protein
MSYIYTYDGSNSSINLWVTTFGEILFYFKQTLKQAGWTVIKSGDGLSLYSSSTDIITHSGSGAGGINNTNGWFVLKHPTSSRQIQMWRGSASYSSVCGNIYYSYSAGFTGGSPTATTRSTATDEKLLMATDVYSTVAPIALNTNMRLHIVADNSGSYGFYAFWHALGGGAPTAVWMMDPLLPGTYSASDVDPYIYYFTSNSIYYEPGFAPSAISGGSPGFYSSGIGSESSSPATAKGWYRKGYANEGFANIPAMAYTSGGGIAIPGSTVINPFNGYDATFPIFYGRRTGLTTQVNIKGMSSIAQWSGVTRNTGDTLSIGGPNARDKIVCGNLALPWNGSVPKV